MSCNTWGGGACSPRKFSENRCSEIVSEAIWDRTRAVVAIHKKVARGVLHPIFGCLCVCICMPADFEFPREKVLRLTEQ